MIEKGDKVITPTHGTGTVVDTSTGWAKVALDDHYEKDTNYHSSCGSDVQVSDLYNKMVVPFDPNQLKKTEG